MRAHSLKYRQSRDWEDEEERHTSRHTENGLEPKLAQSLQNVATDKCFAGHLDFCLLQKNPDSERKISSVSLQGSVR